MKIIKYTKYGLAALTVALFATACSDEYYDVNTDKDSPSIAPLSALLTNTQVALGAAGDFQFYTGDIMQVYTHQMVVREEPDQYGTKVDNINLQNEWNNLYLTLTDLNSIIDQGTRDEAPAYVGIAQMEKAYLLAFAVDIWGDIPFSEANKLKDEAIIAPKFDNQEEVYAAVFELIEQAKVNMATESVITPSTNDIFYGGDMDKWIKFANTFKFKLYNQVRNTPLFNAADFAALVAEDNFMESSADDFEFKHTTNQTPSDERNRFFVASYGSTQFSTYMSPWFYEILKGMNPNIHTGNPDPRIPYYFFNQLTAGQFPPDQGDAETGNPKADYWDASTGFFSIRFGSTGPWRDSSAENSYTYPGIFPTGGRYDDGEGGVMDINGGTGRAPKRILTYDEFLYIKAELMLAGVLSGDAGTQLEEAMNASFAKVDAVVAGTGTTQDVPVLTGSSDVTDFIADVMTEYASGDAAKKLEIIMTQKWVATFGDPADQYTDYRRTGFPVLANPNGPSPEYQLNNNDGFPLIDSQTVQNNLFQVSLFWPQSELNANASAPAQKNPGTYTIFWDN
ncbi:SusD/RagB family nutrient-binding outer membrane lipoprotein [Flavobacterium sp. AG291]|uniref:SusD/RagB family nutrient-binding outer membrane lipoprotein n=1 Tax=Flavobacterium sp. AG291 TaxID=2184000 RepID=UPI000E0C2A40|nr:SusD/RagB family nutrient-binding outer membrane lipoprotein [Flavobacterium sp. AG291]RDI12253.1 SusD-like starch-binding protein associating with outer membrane [Flavobacterium sp. AG291]